jgi:hypothetical protein
MYVYQEYDNKIGGGMATFEGPGPSYYEPPDVEEGREDRDMAALAEAAEMAGRDLLDKWRYVKGVNDEVDVDLEDALAALKVLKESAGEYRIIPESDPDVGCDDRRGT